MMIPETIAGRFGCLHRSASLIVGLCLHLLAASIPMLASVPSSIPFDLPSDTADRSLKRLADQSGVEVVFSTEIAVRVRTNTVTGLFTPIEAAQRMLVGTEIQAAQKSPTAAIVVSRRGPAKPEGEKKAQGAPSIPASAAVPATAIGEPRQSSAITSIDDAPIRLSPFEVSSDKDVGYQGGNTTSGSRLNASLKDTSAAITVFTSEFLSDLGATSLADIIGYAPNMEMEMAQYSPSPDTSFLGGSDRRETTIRIRGLAANTAMDFFPTGIKIDTYNTERIEQSSGPNSILFGFGSPGGLVNVSTKRAQSICDRTSTRLQLGSNSFKRFEIDHNQVLIPQRLALRLNGLLQRNESWRKYNFDYSERLAGSLQWKPWQETTLSFNYERGRLRSSVDRSYNAFDSLALYEASGAPQKSDAQYNATTDHAVGINRNTSVRTTYVTNADGSAPLVIRNSNANGRRFLESTYENLNIPEAQQAGSTLLPASQLPFDINIFGTGAWRETNFSRVFATLEQRLTRDLVLDLTVNREYGFQDVRSIANATNIFYRDPNTVIPNPDGSANPVPNPYAGRYYMEGQWAADKGAVGDDAVRLSLSWNVNLGRWGRHNFAGMAEYNKYNYYRYGGFEIMVDEANIAINTPGAPGNANNRLYRRQYVTPGDFETYIPGSPDIPVTLISGGKTYRNTVVFNNTNSNDVDRITKTQMLVTQSRFFHDRLVLTAGVRDDRLAFDTHMIKILAAGDPGVGPGGAIAGSPVYTDDIDPTKRDKYHPRTSTLGAVLHATRVISIFYNYADNNGQPGTNRVLPDLTLGRPTVGVSDDAGFMLNLLDGKIFLRATAYRTAQQYVGSTIISSGADNIGDPNRRILQTLLDNKRITDEEFAAHDFGSGPNVVAQSDSETRGYDLSLAFNPASSLTGILNYSYSQTKRTNLIKEFDAWYERQVAFWHRTPGAGSLVNAATAQTVDQTAALILSNIAIKRDSLNLNHGNRPHKINGSARYTFADGTFKGAFIGGGVRWQSRALIGRTIISVDASGRTVLGDNYYGPESFNVDAFAGFRKKVSIGGHKSDFSLQLNVYNLTDEPEVAVLRYNNYKSGYRKVLLSDPRQFRVTAGFGF